MSKSELMLAGLIKNVAFILYLFKVKNQFKELGEGMKNTWRALGIAFADTVVDHAGKQQK